MPRNDQFKYDGLKVDHADDWNALDFNNRQGKYKPPQQTNTSDNGPTDVKGMLSSRSRRIKNDQLPQTLVDETRAAAMKDWRSRGLSDNTIEDN